MSYLYWTPLVATLRAAAWLEEFNIRQVCDIGSGVGKFCVVAALAGRARFIGIEQRARLVAVARELARTFGVAERVTFVHGNFGEGSVPDADAYYFYNSFGENLFEADDCLDVEVELSETRYVADIAAAECMLRGARLGTYLLTYNGFGGEVPNSYSEVRIDRELPCVLSLWQKTT
ncbi:MAG TPA: methyltransferase domain-containing protein [Polyangiaceae bacterium]